MSDITRIVQTVAEKDSFLASMVAELLKPEVDRKLPSFCKVFVSDVNKHFTLNANTATSEEAIIISPSAQKISKTVGTGGILQGQKFGLNSSGEMVASTYSSTITQSQLTVSSAEYLGMTEKMGDGKWFVIDGDTTSKIYAVKIVGGVLTKSNEISLSALANAMIKISDTQVLVQKTTFVQVVSVDWATMVATAGTAVSSTTAYVPYKSGIVAGSVPGEYWAYGLSTNSIVKRKITVTAGVPVADATLTTTSLSIMAGYSGFSIKSHGGGYATLFFSKSSTASAPQIIGLVKISPNPDGTLLESTSQELFASCNNGTNAFTSPISFSKNRSIILNYEFSGNATSRGIFSGFEIDHTNTTLDSIRQIAFKNLPDFGLKLSSAYWLPYLAMQIEEDKIAMFYQYGADIKKTIGTISNFCCEFGESETVYTNTNIRFGSQTNQFVYLTLPIFGNGAVNLLTENQDSNIVISTATSDNIVPIGISDQTKTAGQIAIGTLFGGVATVGTGLTAGAKVYFDTTAGVNQTQTGYEIGRAVGTTDILTIPQ